MNPGSEPQHSHLVSRWQFRTRLTSTARARTVNLGHTVTWIGVFPIIKAHASQSPFPGRDRAGQAGAGGARTRAMSDKICRNIFRNICLDTATSASWKVT